MVTTKFLLRSKFKTQYAPENQKDKLDAHVNIMEKNVNLPCLENKHDMNLPCQLSMSPMLKDDMNLTWQLSMSPMLKHDMNDMATKYLSNAKT